MNRWVPLTRDCSCDCLTLSLRGCQCGEGLPARLPPIGDGDAYRVRDESGTEIEATYAAGEWLDPDGCPVVPVAIELSQKSTARV